MARKTATKPAKKKTTRDEREVALFPDVEVTPVRRASAKSSSEKSGVKSAVKNVAKKPTSDRAKPVASAPASDRVQASAPAAPARSSTMKVVAAGGAVIACFAVAGVLGSRLFAPEAERTAAPSVAHASDRPTALTHVAVRAQVENTAGCESAPTSGDAAPAVASLPVQASESAATTGELASALKGLLAASQTRDAKAIAAAHEALERLVSANPTAAISAVMAALRAETDDQNLALLSSVLLMDDLAGRPEVLAALTEMAKQDDLASRRATAVRTLGNLPGGDASRVDLLSGLERSDSDPSVREAAALALGVVGDRSPGDVAAAAAKDLIAAVAAETDPRVRSMLLYAVRDTRGPDVTDVLLQALNHDSDAAPRLAAADMLGDVAAAYRSRAVDALAAQFAQDGSDPRLGPTIVKSIVSAGRLSAIPVLQGLRAGAGSCQTLIDDYLAGLTSGEDNMDKLEAMKLARETARAR